MAITPATFPVIDAGSRLQLAYYAKVSSDIPNSTDVNAANVVLTISIAD